MGLTHMFSFVLFNYLVIKSLMSRHGKPLNSLLFRFIYLFIHLFIYLFILFIYLFIYFFFLLTQPPTRPAAAHRYASI